MTECARPGCYTTGKSSCSVCTREQYCSSICQKLDWKFHKSICPILKKLSSKLQPFHEVFRITTEILESKKGNKARVLKHLLSYAEFQFGKAVSGKGYRERGYSERISNWNVDVLVLNDINRKLANLYDQDYSLGTINSDDIMSPYLERSLSLLNPWLTHLDSNDSNKSLDNDQVNRLLHELFCTEVNMAAVTTNRMQYDIAEGHCQRSLAYSKRFGVEGENKTTLIFLALKSYCSLRDHQGDYSGALTFAEECYNLVVVAYDCVHPQVQQAAGILINILIAKGDLYDAERYAEVTYGNLRDKKNGMDQEGKEVAKGSYNLANVIYQQRKDFIKAEELAREALRIRTIIYGSDHHSVGMSSDLLAGILQAQSKLGDETRELFQRTLAIFIRNDIPDGTNTATGNFNIGRFYHQVAEMQPTLDSKQKHLLLAESHLKESIRIYSKIYGPTHPNTVDAASRLVNVLNEFNCLLY